MEPTSGTQEAFSTLSGRAKFALPLKLSKLDEPNFGGVASEAADGSSSNAQSTLDSLQGRRAQVDLWSSKSTPHTCQIMSKVPSRSPSAPVH